MRFWRLLSIVLLGFAFGAASALAKTPDLPSYEPWDEEIVEAFKALPIQQGGRVKPMEAFARVKLLRYHSRRSMKLLVGSGDEMEKVKISAAEWLLDVLFRPELARQFPTFIVNDSDAVIAIGIEEHEKRRSRYTHDEMMAGRQKLSTLGRQYAQVEEKDRTGKQNQIVDLGSNVGEFEFLNHLFDFARDGLEMELPEVDAALTGSGIRVTTFLENIAKIRQRSEDEAERLRLAEALNISNNQMGLYLNTATAIAFTPPPEKVSQAVDQTSEGADEMRVINEWLTPAKLLEAGISKGAEAGGENEFEVSNLLLLEQLGRAAPNSPEFKAALDELNSATQLGIERIGEKPKIGVELALYRGKYPANTLVVLIFGFLAMSIGLLAPDSGFGGILRKSGTVCGVIALALLCVWITLRCVVMGRPPVANLYETILFIVAVMLLLGLLFHFLGTRPVILPAVLFASIIGIFISGLYDGMKGEDTMDPLVAVLNSNFWLATHVTIVTMGYAAGLLAAAISHIYIFARLFGSQDKAFLRDITRMVYAVICFTLLFSLVGTILGGIWANVSWGRFWGWDPKENGALLIVLVTLAILHGRVGGFLRQDGINICSIILGMVVAFSWWWVNVMGVGLHSYGFTSGIKKAVMIFWGIQVAVIVCAIIAKYQFSGPKVPPASPPTPAPEA